MDAGREVRRLAVEPASELSPALAEQVLQAARETEADGGAPPLNDDQSAALRHPDSLRGEVRVRHFPLHTCTDGALGDLVGYGVLITDQSSELAADPTGTLFVRPGHRRQGLGRALVARMHEDTDRNVHLWAPHDTIAAQRLARAAHMVPSRELLVMERSLGDDQPLPDVGVPAGFRLRAFDPGSDQPAFLALNARAFAHHPEQGSLGESDLRAKLAEPWFDPAGFFLAEDESGALLGFHWTKIHPDGTGEVYVIGVDPDAEGRGLAKALLVRGLRRLAERGCREVILYVEGDHDRAVGMYEKYGFDVRHRDVLYAQHLQHPAADQR